MFPENISIICMKFFERFCSIIIIILWNHFIDDESWEPLDET